MGMGRWLKVGLTLALGLGAAAVGRAQGVDLKVGDLAPGFSLRGSDGKTHTLAEHKGRNAVVVAWFPKAITGG